MYLGLDQRLMVTIQVLKLGGMREEDVALLLAHELSHYLLDHSFYRLVKSLFVNKVVARMMRGAGFKEVYDPTKEEFKTRVADKQRYSCFYP